MAEMQKPATLIDDTVKALSRLRREHEGQATRLQRAVDRFTARAGSPQCALILAALVITWIGVNCLLLALGRKPFDEPPFFWLQGAVTLGALYMTIFIATTQRRENELATHHEHLTLELAMISEQKTAKIISLLEELRQDHPHITNRIDGEADAMSTPSDPHSVLDAIKREMGSSKR